MVKAVAKSVRLSLWVTDVSMQFIQKHCARYLDNYTACVEKFPYTWHLDCEIQKLKLNKCAAGNPTILTIKQNCAESFEKYEDCLHKNVTSHTECAGLLDHFSRCAEKYV